MFSIRCLAGAGLAAALMLAVPARALDIDAATQAKLAAGEAVTKFTPDPSESAAGLIEAVIDIPASRQTVWAILTDCLASVKVFSGLKTCRVVSADPATKSDVREHLISWSRLLPTVRSVFKSQYDEPNEIRFLRTEGR